MTLQISLHWTGPHSYNDVSEMDEDHDFGLYQIYGIHPVYGVDTLLYIGLANGNTFGSRFRNADRVFMNDDNAPWEDNGCGIRIHTGRIHRENTVPTPTDHTWGNWITVAERLLIHAHSPTWNSSSIATPPNGNVGRIRYRDVHILNWGQFGLLLPEVSGARYTEEFFGRLNDDPLGA